MTYRFPGMDPWLEHPATWPGVHDRLITYIADALAERIPGNYTARHGERLVIEAHSRELVPDVVVARRPGGRGGPAAATLDEPEPLVLRLQATETRETFVELRDRRSGNRIVTVIEVLSPSNKRARSRSRREYLRKQSELLDSNVSLVEVDLLRKGKHTVALPEDLLVDERRTHYRVVTRRADRPSDAELYPIRLPQRLPRVRVPLVAPDPDAVLELQPLLERVHVAGSYEADLDYAREPEPPLAPDDLAWARERLGLR